MLRIYYARENIDTSRFMYDAIGRTLSRIRAKFDRIMGGANGDGSVCPDTIRSDTAPERVLLVVPEQYTLQAERDAMDAMGLPGFIDFDVLSMTSLGRRTLAETGGGGGNFIDKYGKIMLVTKLLHDNGSSLKALGTVKPSPALASKISDMISELKNFNVTPEELAGISAKLGDDDVLGRKLFDISVIYGGFENELSNSLLDTADHLKRFTRSIPKSGYIAGSELWLFGYDYISPAMRDAVIALSGKALDVNIMLTADPDDPFFSLTGDLMNELAAQAGEAGVGAERMAVETASGETPDVNASRKMLDGSVSTKSLDECTPNESLDRIDSREAPELRKSRYAKKLPKEIAAIEKNLFAGKTARFSRDGEANDGGGQTALSLTVAAGFYAEAETIASEICGLVRDEGLNYRDILVLCNDMRTRVPIMKRVFQDYGLPVFVDQRRAVDHNPVIELVLALIEIAASGRRYEDVFRLLKTGLTDIGGAEREALENYVLEYKIRGGMWDRDFTYGGSPAAGDEAVRSRYSYSAEEMQALNETRRTVSGLLGVFEKSFRTRRTAREKTECLRGFLENDLMLADKVAALAQALEDSGNLEYAAELSGIETVVAGLLDQLSAALGEREVSPREYSECLRAGFASVRMGILPTGTDQIVIGTMQRTRSADAAAVFVAGANDGVLPAATEDDGVLNSDEKQRLESAGNFLGRSDDTVYFEEQLAIYRNMSKSSKKLYISCSASDMEGNTVRPSNIFERVRRLFPDVPVKKDIISGEDELAQIQYPEEALAHLADNAVKTAAEGRSGLAEPWRGVWKWLGADAAYKPRIASIRSGLAHRSGGERLSPDTLGRLLGAHPVVHTSPSAMERYSRCPFSWFANNALRLTERRVRELDYGGIGDLYHLLLMGYGEKVEQNAQWDEITRAECGEIIRAIYQDAARTYREGLLGNNDGYSGYKAERISRVAEEVAWAVTNQVRGAGVAEMMFEARFGSGAGFSPLEIPVPAASPANGTAESGAKLLISGRIDRVDILAGESAVITDYKSGRDTFSSPDVRGGWQLQLLIYLMAVTEKYRAGGVRYFGISEPHIEDTGRGAAYVEEKISKEFKPDGLFADPGQPHGELEDLTQSVRARLENLAADIFAGSVGASPLTARKLKSIGNAPLSACTYCAYKGMCGYSAP